MYKKFNYELQLIFSYCLILHIPQSSFIFSRFSSLTLILSYFHTLSYCIILPYNLLYSLKFSCCNIFLDSIIFSLSQIFLCPFKFSQPIFSCFPLLSLIFSYFHVFLYYLSFSHIFILSHIVSVSPTHNLSNSHVVIFSWIPSYSLMFFQIQSYFLMFALIFS